MRQLWHDIKTHRLAAALFLVFWLAIWVLPWPGRGIGILGWPYNLALYLHLLMAFVAGALAGWWRNTTAGKLTGGMLAGLLFCVIDEAIFMALQSLPALGRPQLVPEWIWSGFWRVALAEGLIRAVIGIVLGMVGGIISALLAAALRRVRGGGVPAAPPGVSYDSGLPVSVPPPGQPLWRRILGWPSTRLGWWSVALAATAVPLFFANVIETNLGIPVPIVGPAVGVIAGITGLVAMLARRDRSLLVIIALLVSLPCLFWSLIVIGYALLAPEEALRFLGRII